MAQGLRRTPDRHGYRKGNSPFKAMLFSLGIQNTNSSYLKSWLKARVSAYTFLKNDEHPIRIVYDGMIGNFTTYAEACYHVALLERRKGKRL